MGSSSSKYVSKSSHSLSYLESKLPFIRDIFTNCPNASTRVVSIGCKLPKDNTFNNTVDSMVLVHTPYTSANQFNGLYISLQGNPKWNSFLQLSIITPDKHVLEGEELLNAISTTLNSIQGCTTSIFTLVINIGRLPSTRIVSWSSEFFDQILDLIRIRNHPDTVINVIVYDYGLGYTFGVKDYLYMSYFDRYACSKCEMTDILSGMYVTDIARIKQFNSLLINWDSEYIEINESARLNNPKKFKLLILGRGSYCVGSKEITNS